MDFSTLEIIGLAFMSGLKVAEITKELEDEDEKATIEDEEFKTGVIKLEGEKAKKIIDYIQNNLTNKDKEEK
ncbi:MAG: hypothetical protein Q4C11_01760 [Clostridium sp.]|nr:hypothetical protein [Clostridium sp.]